jgi:lipopolysaccharide biosynthesis regulator YciM
MKDSTNYKRLYEIWSANAEFYLKELERAKTLYNQLLKQTERLEMNNRKLLVLLEAAKQWTENPSAENADALRKATFEAVESLRANARVNP